MPSVRRDKHPHHRPGDCFYEFLNITGGKIIIIIIIKKRKSAGCATLQHLSSLAAL